MKIFAILFATFTMSIISNAQATKQKATIYFKDGTELSCYARISGDFIRYSEEKQGVELKGNFKEISKLQIRMNDQLLVFIYKTEKGKTQPRLFELIVEGDVCLYRISDVYEKKIGFHSNKNVLKHKTSSTKYFLECKEDAALVFRFKNDFMEKAKEYFLDCPLLVEKIANESFRQKDLLEIVLFYNENCK